MRDQLSSAVAKAVLAVGFVSTASCHSSAPAVQRDAAPRASL